MSRPTLLHFDPDALRHNIQRVKFFAPHQKIIAMVKANAYGCGLEKVLPILQPYVDAFGVTNADEAVMVRQLSHDCRCILFHGVYSGQELETVSQLDLECVIHHALQLQWILARPSPKPLKIWVKINTGMNRLGFSEEDIPEVMAALLACPWVFPEIGLITHLASADDPKDPSNQKQIDRFNDLASIYSNCASSIANSAAIIGLPQSHAQFVRPGIMLYGISPFAHQIAEAFGLKPVMRLTSKITAIQRYPAHTSIGYNATWKSEQPCRIGMLPLGYGDGYPRHIRPGTLGWVNGMTIPIVGRVSMDILTIDLTHCPEAEIGDIVELWGPNMPIELVAQSANTMAYELICQMTQRVTRI